MTTTSVHVARSGAVATVWLQRPEVRNAVDADMASRLRDVLDDLGEQRDLTLVLLRGVGGTFCSGWDVREFRAGDASRLTLTDRFIQNRALLDVVSSLPVPTIAVVEGAAAGFGLSLASRCDTIVAAASARFLVPEVSLGLVPSLVAVELQRVLPHHKVLEWVISGEPRSAADAQEAGLVARVVPDDALDAWLSARAQVMSDHDPQVVRDTKAFVRSIGSLDRETASVQAVEVAARSVVAQSGIEAR